MFKKARSGRDAFTFSLQGMTTIASFTLAPAIADDQFNQAWERRSDGASTRHRKAVHRIEDFLARYFAPGCIQAT